MNKEDVDCVCVCVCVCVFTHTHVYYGILLNLENNEIVPFAATWMDLEIILLSCKSEKGKYMTSLICGI